MWFIVRILKLIYILQSHFFQLQGKCHESSNKCKKVTGHVGTCSSGSLKLGGEQVSGRKSKETHYCGKILTGRGA